MTIRLVIFDLDDTLWQTPPVIAHAEQRLQDWLAQRVPQLGRVTLERLQDWKQQVLAEQPQLAHSVSAVRHQVLWRALLQAGFSSAQAADAAEEAFQFFLNERQKVNIEPGVRTVLTGLRKQYQVAALSNGNADVRRVGLGDCFDFALNADGLGVGKPDVAAFRTALGRAGVQPAQAVHVGDSPRDDVAGALNAGLHAVWFNPQGLEWPGGRPASAEIRRLEELPAVLQRLG